MFGFRKSVKELIEPGFDKDSSLSQEQDKSIADILGAEENDTNITAGVDAILDEDATLDNHQTEINQNIDLSSLETPAEDFSENDMLTEELAEQFSENQETSPNEAVSPDMDWNTEPESTEISDIDNITESQENFPVNDEQESFSEPLDDSSVTSSMEETKESFESYSETEDAVKTEEDSSIPSFFTEDVKEEDGILSEEFLNADADENNRNDEFVLDDVLGTEADLSVDDITQEDLPTIEKEDGEENQNSDFMMTEQNEVPDSSENEDFENNLQEETKDDSLETDDLPSSEDLPNDEPFSFDENIETEETSSLDNNDISDDLPSLDDLQNDESFSIDENSDDKEISFENLENSDETSFLAEEDDVSLEDENTEVVSEENKEQTVDEVKPFSISEGSYESYDDTLSEDSVKVDLDNDLWAVSSLEDLCEKPKVINSNSGSVTWGGDKYQSDLKIEIESLQEIENWNMLVLHDFSVPLDENATELVIDKAPDVVRFASLMHKGQEKLKVFNQSSYKFIAPQGEFFAVQGNVICGHVDKTFSLNIHDYVRLPVQSMLNQYVGFKQPASGFILGPKGVTVFFATAKGVAFVVKEQLPEAEVFEYEPSLKKFDSRKNFVYDEKSGTTEFMATGKQNCLVINTGASLYGWNIRFDNEMFLSLKDVLTYQAKQNALPSPNGELIHDGKVFKFFGIEKIQARPKVLYYSYGKV